ncbi:NAD-dependent malic enzyme [Pajaroellobacter abortibovis]|uniref:NAD-dependent malic enzyme n=1 Tax=Pajaroellobacter abortibovis TaxID=1882918 RepID=A0A1L6MWA9_9BACT|nr:NAD-dependent malic enzyme [Pajaroellobacter abortibovis]APR99830.1 NAD-dependent malic enzyme [Pajaroellobacter abortibovis]
MQPLTPFIFLKNDEPTPSLATTLEGHSILLNPLLNKGTAFTLEERADLKLVGFLPPTPMTLEQQIEISYGEFQRCSSPIHQYMFLRALQERNEVLYFSLLERHLEEMLPIIYTPTIGDVIQRFSSLCIHSRGLSLSPHNIQEVEALIQNYPLQDIRMVVVTDSSAILGIGDQGYGGINITIGKLALYTVAGGMNPFHTLPVGLDVGTNRADLLNNSLYIGTRTKRLTGSSYSDFLDRFVEAIHKQHPQAVIQWEDFAKEVAFSVLERYRKTLPSFNDDIQGTGAVALAGVLSACRIRGEKLQDQWIVIHGAGAGGIGVAWAFKEGMKKEGLTEEKARARIFVTDSQGLLTTDRKMEAYKIPYAQDPAILKGWRFQNQIPNLIETLGNSQATILIGLSGQGGAFSERVVQTMLAHTKQPIIFPLSNPTSASEAAPDSLLKWTQGNALIATGSPFPPVSLNGISKKIGQGNNAFIFPGLGLGTSLSKAAEVTDSMVLAAAYALHEYTQSSYTLRLYPSISELQQVSMHVTVRVIEQAIRDGVSLLDAAACNNLPEYVRSHFWRAGYLPIKSIKHSP